jgi:hypothetical protein
MSLSRVSMQGKYEGYWLLAIGHWLTVFPARSQ